MKRRTAIAIILCIFAYVASYLIFRQTHAEVWQRDGKTYVIFHENKVLYYCFRPLSFVDEKVTGISFHIGQHRE